MSTGNASRNQTNEFRVYAPGRTRTVVNGNLAVKSEALPRTRVAEPLPNEPARRPRLVPVKQPKQQRRTLPELVRDYKVVPKAMAVAVVLAMAFALIFMISGFSNISAAQKEINRLSKKVTEMERAVEKTNVDLLFSIDAGAAHDAARDAGMSYPAARNFGR